MYGDSRTLSTDASLIFASNSKPKREELTKSIATIGGRQVSMDSDVSFDNYRQQQNTQPNYGLLRFRSAPTSLLQNSTDGVDKNAGNSNPEARDLSTRFNSYGANGNLMFQDLEDSKRMVNGYSLNSQLPPQYPRQSSGTQVGAAAVMNGSYGAVENQGQVKLGSSLMKQNGSAAGLFSHPAAQNGYASVRGAGSYRVGNAASGNLSPSSSRLKGQMSFSSGVPSSLGLLSEISEVENGNVGAGSIDNGKLGSGNVYSSGFPFASWNDSSQFSENFNGLKGSMDDETKLFANTQNGEIGNRMSILSHNLSLPKTSAETAVMEKLLQFQDSVPCKIRAKRGCATHPRSIAERVRRTRISERMRKLQELVPNMDKQTNTADMLDLAVEYIKDLQKQYKTLSYNRANCKCSGTQKPVPNRTV